MTEWILPTNPKNFRTDDAMRALGALEWFQSRSIKNIQIGDVVYLYVSTPVQEIHWKMLGDRYWQNDSPDKRRSSFFQL